jgi:putative PIN family toxin of toxin-antitoxin system
VKIVLDTNVFVSGIYFGGVPGIILDAWRDGRVDLAVSLEILSEYERVANELAVKYPEIEAAPILSLVALGAEFYDCPSLDEQACADPDDDKVLACALAAGSTCVVSGDKLLLKVSGYCEIQVVSPRDFVNRYLQAEPNKCPLIRRMPHFRWRRGWACGIR